MVDQMADRKLTQFRLSDLAVQRLEALANPGESLNLAAKRLLEETLFKTGLEECPSPSKLEAIEHRLSRIEEWSTNIGERLETLEQGFDGLGYAVHRLDSISQYDVDPEVEAESSNHDWEDHVLEALEEEELEKRGRHSVDQKVDQQVDQDEENPPILNACGMRYLSHGALAKRLGVTPATLARHRKKIDFKAWNRKKDMQGMQWTYDPVAKNYQGVFP